MNLGPAIISCNPVLLDAGNTGSTFDWNNGAGNGQTFTASTSGNYTVVVTNTDGCSATASVQVTINSAPTVSLTNPAPQCGGTVSLDAGNAGATFAWSSGETTQVITVSTSGNYSVTVTNGCGSSTASALVTINSAPVVNLAPSPTSCIPVVLDAENPGSTYLWSPGGQTTQTISATSSGTYSVVVTNADGCTGTGTSVVTITPGAPVVNLSNPAPQCGGTLTLDAGNAGSSYLWSPGGETTQTISAVASGTYQVTVTNTCGSSTGSAVVTINAIPVVNLGGPYAQCGGVVLDAGNPGSTYNWNSGQGFSQTFNAVANGTYTVVVTSPQGCSGTGSAVVNSNGSFPVVNLGGPFVQCNGTVTLDAGNPGASYLWSPGGETTPVITVNTSGTYTVTVTNACGSSTGSAVVTIITTSAIGSVTPSGPTTFCQGGSVDLTAATGSSYLWSTGETSQTISVTQTGNYSVTITTAQGCQILSPVTGVNVLPALPIPTITSSGSGNICNGQSITLTSSGATGNTWNPNGLQSQSIIVSNPGSYTVTVSNGQCSATSLPFVVTLNFPPSAVITAIGNTTFCKGDSVLLQAPAAASYTWFKVGLNGNPDVNIGNDSSVVVNQSGDYYVVVTGANGCTRASFPSTNVVAQDTVAKPTFTVDGALSPCNSGSFITLTAATASNYQWSQGETTQSIRVIGPGNYFLTVTNSFGCSKNSDTLVVNLTPSPNINLNLVAMVFNPGGHNVSLPGGSDGQIDLTVTGGLAPFQFSWTKEGTGFIGSSEDLIGLKAGVYTVVVTDAGGCTAEANIILTEPKEFKLSNGFSPNNDGKNDQFVIGSIELYPDNDITIYNRWGNVVFSKTGYANDWEGLSNSGESLADGTYFIVVNVRSNGASQQLKGYVDLRR